MNRKNARISQETASRMALVYRLQRSAATRGGRRLGEIVRLVQSLQGDLSRADRRDNLTRLRVLLSAYEYVHGVTPNGVPVMLPSSRSVPEFETWERSAVAEVVSMARDPKTLSRIRRCSCGDWFLVRGRLDRVTCSAACKQRRVYDDPAKREQKRQAMREHRRREKERLVRELERVGYAGNSTGRAKRSR